MSRGQAVKNMANRFLNRNPFSGTNVNPGGIQSQMKSHKGKKIAGMGVVGAGFTLMGSLSDGDSLGTAAVKTAADAMLWTAAPWAMTAYTAATMAPDAINAGYDWYRGQQAWWQNQHLPRFGGNYQDTQRALTMRQAAVQAIQGSKLNARSALGGEAAIFTQNYFRG